MDLFHEIEAVLTTGDATTIKSFFAKPNVKEFYSKLKNGESTDLLDNIELFLSICKTVSGRTEEIKSDLELFLAIEDFTDGFEKPYTTLLEGCDDLSEETVLWESVVSLYKMALDTGCPCILGSYHWILHSEEKMLWKELDIDTQVEIYKLLITVLPRVVGKIPKVTARNRPDQQYNSLIYDSYFQIADLLPKRIDHRIQPLLIEVIEYVADKLCEPTKKRDESSPYYLIFIHSVACLCFQRVDLCVTLMPVFEKMKNCGFSNDDPLTALTNNCLRMAIEKQGDDVSPISIQNHIDVFLKEGFDDPTQVTPGLMLKVYQRHPDIIHRNLPAVATRLPDMPVHHIMKICELLKVVSAQQPQEFNDVILESLSSCLRKPGYLCHYHILDVLAKICFSGCHRVDITAVMQFAESNSAYMPTICEMLGSVGANSNCTSTKAGEILGWLLPQCMNPIMSSHRASMLKTAKVIGMKYKNQLMQYKPLITTLNSDVMIKDVTDSILDFLEDRSLMGVSKQVDKNAAKIEKVASDLVDTTNDVTTLGETLLKQTDDINVLSAEVEIQKQNVRIVKAELAEAMIDIERIDRKTVDTTPTWSHDVAKLLDPESPADWKLLAKRLGYSNDDLRAWASHESPCMSMLVEWFTTHSSSEATRAVYVVLVDMGRDDATQVVGDAMQKAGELVPTDEPLDLKNPPSIFISYQWSIQDKAITLKNYLTDAGFSCWLDIGQMGGGDKLYEKIDGGIRSAKIILSLVTEKYAQSAMCNKEVSLAVSLQKPVFPLLMEKMTWPPVGSMGPIFSEYLFVRFFQREAEQKKGVYWPEAKMVELLMQIRLVIEPDVKLLTKAMDDWWLTNTGYRVTGSKQRKGDNSKQPEIFISYQWGKQKEVHSLYKKLTSLGFTCWLDIEQMGAGNSLFDKIDRGIRNCKVVLSCVTEKYALSLNCKREVTLCSSLSKPIIPLLLESATWPPAGPMGMLLGQLQYIDCSQGSELTGSPQFTVLLAVLIQHGVFSNKTLSKDVSSLITTMQSVRKFAKARWPTKKDGRKVAASSTSLESPNTSSKSCCIL